MCYHNPCNCRSNSSQNGCSPYSDKKYPSLAKLYMEAPLENFYKAYCSKIELIQGCLSTSDGSQSTDNKLYRRGRDLMVKIDSGSSICYKRVATVIIDEYNILSDFEIVAGTVKESQVVPKMTCLELIEISDTMNS